MKAALRLYIASAFNPHNFEISASAPKRNANNWCLYHEIHEYDQDQNSNNVSVPDALLCPPSVYIPKSSASDRAIGWSLSKNGLSFSLVSWLFAWRGNNFRPLIIQTFFPLWFISRV